MYSLPAALKRKPPIIALLVTFLATLLLIATGQSMEQQAKKENTKGNVLKIHEVATTLLQQGFYDIREIEFEHRVYEVNARNADGHKVEIEMDAVSGNILTIEDD